jgi:hypothetical protein
MGQCSTLPAETKQAEMREQTDRLNENGRKESLDFNVLVPIADPVKTRKPPKAFSPVQDPQTREPDRMDSMPMEVDTRDEAAISLPPPPENAVRTRCYKLNLDSDISSFSSTTRQQICLGPFTDAPPHLTYSSSEDSQEASETAVAIQTAQIFRGITVSRDGTILSQNARATRSNRGNKTKVSEKSRQAAKIDKAKDLVEDCTDAKMVSLVVVGEYDDMKQLVRDGSRKLREAEGLPDEALLSVNRPRSTKSRSSQKSSRTPTSTSTSTRRRRTSSSPVTSVVPSPKAFPQSAPPKLKSNPRDTRRKDGLRMRLDTCNDFMERRSDDDWTHAWNIWNCGGGGTVSPLQPSSPNKNVIEGRNDVAYGNSAREGGFTSRAG